MQPNSQLPICLVNKFSSVSLDELKRFGFPARFDTKFCISELLLTDFLSVLLEDNFSIVALKKNVFSTLYETVYYDDASFSHFHSHRQGKLPRSKFRARWYVETDQCFIEKKTKNQAQKTIKKRLFIDHESVNEIVLQKKFNANYLQESLKIGYERMSFLCASRAIKITIDRFLSVDGQYIMPDFFIVEVKKSRPSMQDLALLKKFLQLHRIRNMSFSKYCVGLCWKHEHLPKNKWKQVFKKYIVS